MSFETCAKDGEQTVEALKQAFEAFDNKEIYRGMQLIGQALIDVYKAFEACEETEIAKELEKLANDFIKCTAGMSKTTEVNRISASNWYLVVIFAKICRPAEKFE